MVLKCSENSGLSEFSPAQRGNMATRFPLCFLLVVFVVTAHVTGAAEEEERGGPRKVVTEEDDSPQADDEWGWLSHLSE